MLGIGAAIQLKSNTLRTPLPTVRNAPLTSRRNSEYVLTRIGKTTIAAIRWLVALAVGWPLLPVVALLHLAKYLAAPAPGHEASASNRASATHADVPDRVIGYH